MMRINFNRIPKYRLWRNGSAKKAGSKGRPGSKLMKRMVRDQLKKAVRKQRLENMVRESPYRWYK